MATATPQAKVPWSTGLCDCFSDGRSCCMTCWCPCVTFGRIADIVNRGSPSCCYSGVRYTLLGCITCSLSLSLMTWSNRSKMRRRYNLEGSDCKDCLTHCFCTSCAMCQEYRQLQSFGFDMKQGWDGNKEKSSTKAPAVEGGMNR